MALRAGWAHNKGGLMVVGGFGWYGCILAVQHSELERSMIASTARTYTNKRGQTTHCDVTGRAYHGLRHRLHRNDASNECNVTVDLFAHQQEAGDWRGLCIEQDHNEGKTTAAYIQQPYNTLTALMFDADRIIDSSGYR